MKKIIFILIFIISVSIYYSQNLIYNGGFEIYKKCPDRFSEIEKALGWKTPSKGSSDYFNSCSSNRLVSVPNNAEGVSYPNNGNGYAGFGYFFKEKHIEYIQTKLLKPLIVNKKYCLEFYVKKASKYRSSFNELSVLFSKEEVKMEHSGFYDNNIITENNIVTLNIPLEKKDNWTKITFCYKPKTEEQYLTIGFNNPIDINRLNKQAKLVGSYYYIDDVSLVEIKDSSECKCIEESPTKKDSVKVEIVKSYYDSAAVKPFILNNLVFASNKSELLPASNAALDKLVNYLKTNPTKTIELFGYTDNKGKEDDNIKLSTARVKSVADYLIQQGVETKRITYKGYGSKNPLVPNNTEVNKTKNRRVEFKFKPATQDMR